MQTKFFMVTFFVLVVISVVFWVTAARAEEKIALVSLQAALNTVDEGKAAKDLLKKDYDAKIAKLTTMNNEVEKMGKDLDSQAAVLSQDAIQQKRKELQTKWLDLQNQRATFEREWRTKEAESTNKILTAMGQMVADLAKKSGYTLVVENSQNTVLYSANATDITPTLIAEYNKQKK